MSLHLEFEPHSWHKGFAIKHEKMEHMRRDDWRAYTANGNTGYIDELYANTLKQLKQQITEYHAKNNERNARNRAIIGG